LRASGDLAAERSAAVQNWPRTIIARAKIETSCTRQGIVGRWKARPLLRIRYGCETPVARNGV
jgi:hypothetical protein